MRDTTREPDQRNNVRYAETPNTISLELEQDTGAIAFQHAFYRKYSTLYYSLSEKEKSSNMKIRMLLKNDLYVDITRDELDLYLSKYRQIYKSFFVLKNHISNKGMNSFDAQFNFENYLHVNKVYSEHMYLGSDPFQIKWIGNHNTIVDTNS